MCAGPPISIIATRPIKLRTASPRDAGAGAHWCDSKPRTQEAGSTPVAALRAHLAGTGLQPTDVRAPSSYRINHRSARSRCRLRMSSSIVMTGWRGGGRCPTESGGAIHPCRKASNNRASESIELRVGRGGAISATTRSRSVTRTVSPSPFSACAYFELGTDYAPDPFIYETFLSQTFEAVRRVRRRSRR